MLWQHAVERTANHTEIHKLGEGYEMPSRAVGRYGSQLQCTMRCHEVNAERARKGRWTNASWKSAPTATKGTPCLDPQKYRSKEEVAEYQAKDPITLMFG